ncbi:Glycerophosphoryl diester phosphodiesterase [Palleronia salina]|uniref:Glycerophosphoryl diester phosphodiesterase n=1 Tax=Palleronia salina TaxID=313368 RepID=A0A1M6CJ16_9RHOB|nr:glycerophosphodiester phosphodiesterase family protein [Palleronia salina]SHI60903.1 Glycerophosphoryl diester phosphodiesterase [Palleronia salina]
MTLPRTFLDRPLAHRGLHDLSAGVVENSMAAFEAAAEAGYGIELDVQISADGVPVVFHDHTLDRVTDRTGPVNALTAETLGKTRLAGSDDTILTLEQVLDRLGNRTPVVVEIKDQSDSALAGAALDQETGRVLRAARDRHGSDVAVMSFNPQYIVGLSWLGEDIPRGITSGTIDDYATDLPEQVRRDLAANLYYEAAGAWFVSHNHRDLANPRIAELKAKGAAILCWTVRNASEAKTALRIADNITFEGFRPA